ncbi:dedicator of cytokinesis protein 9-like isoform X2 [Saccostrea cucullata]|uniref:dedicator of cytokinesis protein 9-like isoform X2 n=1 Tax=Saccostrea cuccullata TaxID=36930 RepID=UPI002ED62D6B
MNKKKKFILPLPQRSISIEVNNNYDFSSPEKGIVMARPKQVDPVDYETYIGKNKSILHNDPQREMLTFPYDDIIIPPPNPPKRMRTLYSTVPDSALDEAKDLLLRQCIKSYTDSCHIVRFKYSAYAGRYEKLPNIKNTDPLPQHTFEIDAEPEERGDEDTKSLTARIQKTGWLYKGPDGGKENIISFTRQFKKRYFILKQESDFTYSLQFYKDERKTDAKGAIFLDLATEARPNSKRGKHCFEVVLTNDRPPYVFAAESETEMNDWIRVLNKAINAAETASNVSMERNREEVQTPDKSGEKAEISMHPELVKYNRESDLMLTKAREENRHNLFRVYPGIRFHFDEDDEEEDENQEDIEVFPATVCDHYLMRLVDFKLKTQVNLAEEGLGQKFANPEPFFLSFALYDAKEGKKISEDFYIDPNEKEIRQMVPDDVLLASDKLHSVEGRNTSPNLHDLSEEWLLKKDRHGVFSVTSCHAEVYLFVRVEKVLQGSLSQACDQYLKAPSGNKVYKQMRQFCSQIGHHRMPFGWAARQLIIETNGPAELKIYRQDPSKFSEQEVIKVLQDLKKPEKQGKLQEIPGCLKITIHKTNPDQPLQNTLTSSLVPIKPFPIPPPDPPAIEVEQFVLDRASFCDTFDSYVNHLYVYPMNLRYEHQKSFTKARNIACCVEIRDSDDENAIPLKRIYARPEVGVFTTVASATVLHHNTSPDFLEEVKIALPIQLHDKHHILFRFYHVSCEGSKSNRSSASSIKKRDNIETPVGFAWLPLLSQGRVSVGEQSIQVAACTSLPKDYLSARSPDRSIPAPEIKWVDNGKPIFKVKVHLQSTVYTKDQHLHNFFYHCQKIENALMPGTDVDSLNKIKSLHAVDVLTYVQFLPTVLNQLFSLLVKTISDDVALNAVKVLIHIVTEVSLADKQDALKSYVKYVFNPDPIPKGSKNVHTVHEELAKNLTTILRPANADNVVVCKFLKYSWFFFEILIKSMALYLIGTDRIKMPRNERFTSDYQFRIQNLLQTLTPNIIQKQREMPRETKMANQSLAKFVKSCFTLMDRGFVFKNIASYVEQFGPGDSKSLYDLKFEFLCEVCSHEHYIPLCLPIMRKGMIKSFKDIKLEGNFIYHFF